MKRAKAVASLQDAEAPSHSQNGNVDRLEALLGNANTAYDRVETARSAIANPSEFFTAAIGRSSPVYKELFDESDHLKNAGLSGAVI